MTGIVKNKNSHLYRINSVENHLHYIKNQQYHHKKITFEDEYRILLLEYGITPDEKFFP